MKQASLIVDVSCDNGMGFDFAKPTSFEHPTFTIGDSVTYYAVDHTPTFLWDAASYGISAALIPHLETVMEGPATWESNATIRNAIEIREGVIQNPAVLDFQNRSKDYPHDKLA